MSEYEKYECDKCKGTGEYYQCVGHLKRIERQGDAMLLKCPKCHGDGYLDWVENIVGKRPPKMLEASWDSSSHITIDSTAAQVAILYPRGHGKTAFLKAQAQIDREIIQVMSNKIAMEIDNEILKSLGGKEKG
jgi:hypothetical protein